ncbi:hypothetical protein ILYODFUR_038119, partial [Ilyodon furcidens]
LTSSLTSFQEDQTAGLKSHDDSRSLQLLLHLQIHHNRRYGRREVVFAASVHREK